VHHRTSTLGRITAGLGALVVTAGVMVAGAAPAVAAIPVPASCATGRSEIARCVTVAATFDRAPVAGGSARLRLTVTSSIDNDDLRIQIELPAALRADAPPDGFTTQRTVSARPADKGTINRLTAIVDARAGRALNYDIGITAVTAGPTTLRVTAISPRGAEFGSHEVHAPAVVGATAADARLGPAQGDAAAEPMPADRPLVDANPAVPYRKGSLAGLPKPHSDDPKTASPRIAQPSCVTGSFNYSDNNGTFHPSKNLQYQVWDADIFGDDLLAVGLTDGAGAYRACFDNNDGLGGGGQDVYVRAITEGTQYRVEDTDDDAYAFRSTTHDNLGNGATFGFGSLHTADAVHMPAYHAYDEADDALAWTPGDCWDQRDSSCQNIDIKWADNSTEGTFYDSGADEVRLLPADPDTAWVVTHELGHGVMDDVYEDNFPNAERACFPTHFVNKRSGPICAWTEGFADWYASAVLSLPDIPGRGNIETATWGTPDWDDGDAVEGRVAGALWDLFDNVNDGTDTYQDSLGNIWNTFLDHRATTFNQYWTARGQDGRDVTDRALGSLFQNTIDYGFRQQLTDGAEVTGTIPPADHNYHYDTTHAHWSVVALRPPAGADDDLRVYDDRAQTQLLASSLAGVDTVDWVAVDSNAGRRPLGDYYPRVHRVSGAGAYTIEVADAGELLVDTVKRQMTAADVVASYDSCLTVGQQVTFTVTPGDPSQDAQLFVVSSDPADPTTFIRPSGTATAASPTGPGQPETISYTAAQGGCVGVVVINKAGSGTYTLNRS
jgi:hypothetical protein